MRRLLGPAPFPGPCPSSSQCSPFLRSGLALRSSCSVGDGVGTVRPLLRRAKNTARPSLCNRRRSRPFGMVAAMLQPPGHQPVHRQVGAGRGCAQVVAQRAVKAVFQGLDQRARCQFVFHQAGGHDAHAKA